VRAKAERVFWDHLASVRAEAEQIVAIADGRTRTTAIRHLAHRGFQPAIRAGLNEPLAHALERDLKQQITSYIGLRRLDIKNETADGVAEWPTPRSAVRTDFDAALGDLRSSTEKAHEDAARDELARVDRDPIPRPFTLARARDARIIRKGAAGQIAVVLNIGRANDSRARKAVITTGVDASTGEEVKATSSMAKLIVPLSCSKWHENKFLNGKAILRSSLILRRGDRWFLQTQFEMPERHVNLSGASVGVDRGIVNPVAVAVVNGDGAIVQVDQPRGAEIGQSIRTADRRRRDEQRRRGRTTKRHIGRVDHALHVLANDIVNTAKLHRAPVVLENLSGFKKTITAKRVKGARHGGWRKSLKKVQLGKLEGILTYKLALAGLPAPTTVFPAGTSRTCPACGYNDPKNRLSQDGFVCLGCGFSIHADSVGAINIARRGVVMRTIKKGNKLQPLEKNMVEGLRNLDDGGLGPVATLGSRVVADHVSVSDPNDRFAGTRSEAEQKILDASQNQTGDFSSENEADKVLAERVGANFSDPKQEITEQDQSVPPDQV
jgi:hypothetical protein